MKISINGVETLFEGSNEEIWDIYNKIAGINPKEERNGVKMPSTLQQFTQKRSGYAQFIIPSKEEMMKYIEARNNFMHNSASIQKHFFNKKFSSRKRPKEYRKLASELKKIRDILEKKHNGKFEEKRTKSNTLKIYKFNKN